MNIRYRKTVTSHPFNGATFWENETVPDELAESRIRELSLHGRDNCFNTLDTTWFAYSIQVQP